MLLNHSLIHVLILVVVDNGLVQDYDCGIEDNWLVLILVVVDNGLVRYLFNKYGVSNRS